MLDVAIRCHDTGLSYPSGVNRASSGFSSLKGSGDFKR